MQIIPAINCPDFECVKEKLKKAAEFLPSGDWVQLDIADGKFTAHQAWNDPEDLIKLKTKNHKLKTNLEVHLMVEQPEEVIGDWVKAGAKRIIIHLEAIKDLEPITKNLKTYELGLAIAPETTVEGLIPYLKEVKFVQILAVNPGKAGQKFDERVPKKIKFLKENRPDVIIEVDGGINPETAKLCKEAGADILVAGSYIWDSPNPRVAYERLVNLH